MMGWTEQFIIEAICRHTEQELRSDETKTERMKLSACSALESIRRRVNGYGAECFAFVLLVGIMLKEKSDDTECRYKGELEAILEPSVPPVELRRISHRSLSCTGRRSNLLVESFIGGPVE